MRTSQPKESAPMTVLMVDDNKALAEFTRKNILARCPEWNCITANTVAEAKNVVKHSPPAIALIDLHLSSDSGLDFLRSLHQIVPPVKGILVSATVSDELREQVKKYGGYGVMEKPFDVGELLILINRALSDMGHEESKEKTNYEKNNYEKNMYSAEN